MGDASLGIITAWNYAPEHDTGSNEAFVKDYVAAYGRTPDFMSAGGYDGMHLIYEALKKTGGKTDGDALIDAAKGMKWESPRGADRDRSGDPRRGAEHLYPPCREGRRASRVNVIIDTIKDVKDPVLGRMKK